MIQIKLLLLGLSVIGAIGVAVYQHWSAQNQSENQQSYSNRRRRSSSETERDYTPSIPNRKPSTIDLNRRRRRKTSRNVVCAICLALADNDIKTLTCEHKYHRVCIETWFVTDVQKRCPICRRSETEKYCSG